jgi:glycosyltransferase involved in cell wall biosynthesis
MRVAAIIASEHVSGPARQLTALASRLVQSGVGVRVLLLAREAGRRAPLAAHLAAAGVEFRVVPDRRAADIAMLGAVREALEDFDPDLIQTHGYKATAVGYALRHLPGARPWIGCFHGATDKGLRDRIYQRLERWMLGSADAIVLVSKTQLAAIAAHAGRARVIDNAAVPIEETSAAVTDVVPDALPRPIIGVVGRLSREKGVDVFLLACAALRRADVSFHAVVVGDGPERASLQRLCGELNLDDRVRFAGAVPVSTALYRRFDLVVLPSRSEGLPNVLLEALAAGVRVVATSVGAVPEVLSGSGAGVLAPPGDPAALAAGMAAALDADPAAPEAVRARADVLDRYSLEKRVARHLDLYRALVAPGVAAAR